MTDNTSVNLGVDVDNGILHEIERRHPYAYYDYITACENVSLGLRYESMVSLVFIYE